MSHKRYLLEFVDWGLQSWVLGLPIEILPLWISIVITRTEARRLGMFLAMQFLQIFNTAMPRRCLEENIDIDVFNDVFKTLKYHVKHRNFCFTMKCFTLCFIKQQH